VQRPLPLHGEIPEPSTRPSLAIAAKGFRPFFLLAGAFAAAIVPIWLLIVGGVFPPSAYLDAASWHAHEMIFGYAVAVIAGFLLTAVGNWTQRETLIGTPLLALAGLWTLGRVAMSIAPALPRGSAALLDLAFLPVLAVVLARPLIAARNRRNYVMLAVLGALFAANLVTHLDALGVLPLGSARRASLAAIDVVIFLILVIAGRVLPTFTRNATGATNIGSSALLERLIVIAAVALTLIDVVWPETKGTGVAAGVLAVFTIVRAARWGTLRTGRHPLLWILHVGYAWIPVGLLLRAMPVVGVPVWSSLATHALTVGAIGALTLGMMARVALGHTGRPLVASPAMSWAFAAITASAIARVIVPLFALRWHFVALIIAGVLWAVAFVIYLVVYAPALSRPRVDGKAG
jgi:uncharacterized protein involved in response to NO